MFHSESRPGAEGARRIGRAVGDGCDSIAAAGKIANSCQSDNSRRWAPTVRDGLSVCVPWRKRSDKAATAAPLVAGSSARMKLLMTLRETNGRPSWNLRRTSMERIGEAGGRSIREPVRGSGVGPYEAVEEVGYRATGRNVGRKCGVERPRIVGVAGVDEGASGGRRFAPGARPDDN